MIFWVKIVSGESTKSEKKRVIFFVNEKNVTKLYFFAKFFLPKKKCFLCFFLGVWGNQKKAGKPP